MVDWAFLFGVGMDLLLPCFLEYFGVDSLIDELLLAWLIG